MRKYLLGVLVVCTLLLSGCAKDEKLDDNEKTGSFTCTQKMDLEGASTDNVYTVNYKGDYVTSVKTVETVKSSDKTILESVKSRVEELYSNFDDFKYFDYKVEINGDTLTSTVNANYEKMDLNKLLELDASMKSVVKDGKISVNDIKVLYAASSITCE